MKLREKIIAKLVKYDHNGVWTDEDSLLEGMQPMTLLEAWQALKSFGNVDESEENK